MERKRFERIGRSTIISMSVNFCEYTADLGVYPQVIADIP